MRKKAWHAAQRDALCCEMQQACVPAILSDAKCMCPVCCTTSYRHHPWWFVLQVLHAEHVRAHSLKVSPAVSAWHDIIADNIGPSDVMYDTYCVVEHVMQATHEAVPSSSSVFSLNQDIALLQALKVNMQRSTSMWMQFYVKTFAEVRHHLANTILAQVGMQLSTFCGPSWCLKLCQIAHGGMALGRSALHNKAQHNTAGCMLANHISFYEMQQVLQILPVCMPFAQYIICWMQNFVAKMPTKTLLLCVTLEYQCTVLTQLCFIICYCYYCYNYVLLLCVVIGIILLLLLFFSGLVSWPVCTRLGGFRSSSYWCACNCYMHSRRKSSTTAQTDSNRATDKAAGLWRHAASNSVERSVLMLMHAYVSPLAPSPDASDPLVHEVMFGRHTSFLGCLKQVSSGTCITIDLMDKLSWRQEGSCSKLPSIWSSYLWVFPQA